MPIEREFKFVLHDTAALWDALDAGGATGWRIRQGYLPGHGRIRRSTLLLPGGGLSGVVETAFTYKHALADGSGVMEIETALSDQDFDRLWADVHAPVDKVRREFQDDHLWEVDFLYDTAGECYFCMAEVEVDEGEAAPTPPAELAPFVIAAVALDDGAYTNHKLADVEHARALLRGFVFHGRAF